MSFFRKIACLFRRVKTVEDIADLCKTPDVLAFWLWNRIQYVGDKKKWGKREYWQTPEETLSKKNRIGCRSGDCEDFSILAQAVLKIWEFDAKLLVVVGPRVGHCVCCFIWKDDYYHLSNWGLRKTGAELFFDCADYVFADWHYCYEANTAGGIIGDKRVRSDAWNEVNRER